MREIHVSQITEAVRDLCIQANKRLPDDLKALLIDSRDKESNNLAKEILNDLLENLKAGKELDLPICQDTGMAVVFADIGQDVHIVGGNFEDAVNEGIRRGYIEGLLRLSIVKDPLIRKNTDDNSPGIIHTRLISGENIIIKVAPKGFGSENMSAIKMFAPSASKADIVEFILETVTKAGGNPCPPIVVGVGIGGDFEYSAYLSKKALCRSVGKRNENKYYSDMEAEILSKINSLNIGPQGFGGDATAFAVNIETYPTHIAGLPVAVNIGCHVTRHASVTL